LKLAFAGCGKLRAKWRPLPVAEHTLLSLRRHLKQSRMILRSYAEGHRYLSESAIKYSRQCIAAIEDELERLKGG
jgi:hypothetical protein